MKNLDRLMRTKFKLVLLVIINAFLIQTVSGLFEDQAGTYDWRHQHVGRPTFSQIDLITNRLYLATDQNLLGAITIKNGNIAWRKIFESNSNGKVDYVVWSPKEAVVVTGNGQKVQSFNYNNGFANWEYVLFANASQQNQITGLESSHDSELFYFMNGYQVCSVSIRDKACADLPTDDGFEYTHMFVSDQSLFVVGFKDKQMQKLQFNYLLSSILSKSLVSQDWIKPTSNNCVKSSDSNSLVCYSPELDKLFTTQINSGNQIQFSELNVPELNSNAKLAWSSESRYLFVEQLDEETRKCNLYLFKTENNNLALIKTIQSAEAFDVASKSRNDFDFYLVYAKYKENKDLSLNVLNIRNEQKPETSINVVSLSQKEQKSILEFKAHLSEAKNGQVSLVSMCFYNDYSLSVYNNQGSKLFSREEALAYITSVEMVDFPLLRLQEEFEDEFGSTQNDNIISMFVKRVKSQMFQLKEFIQIDLVQRVNTYINNAKRPVPPVASSSTSSSSSSLNSDEISRDEFNLNKLIVATTSVGKVFGIYTSANGKILWSFFLKNLKPFELNNFGKTKLAVPLFLQRTAAHFPNEPQCVLVAKIKTEQGLKSLVYYFNPLTGQPSKGEPREGLILDYQIKQAFITNTPDNHFLKPLVVLDNENKLHVFPEKSSVQFSAKSDKPKILYSADSPNDKDSLIVGYSMTSTSQPLPELWRINIEDETIAAIGSKLAHDRVHSHGKVLGDRSVLYKYLNPNLISVVTTGQDGQQIPFVNVYLIDTVTGSIINSFNHKRCKGPVHIVHSENWFFYSLYNLKYRRFEVTSVELFEGSSQFNSTHFSSLDDIKPIVFSKSYIVQKSFDSVQVTLTEKGITTKDIIVACQSGVIIEVPWFLIDPRRPIKMTEVEKEENLYPYMPEIPLNYEFSLNYYNYVYNVRGIATAPSGLESTSLVFAYGLDTFFTRVYPSKTFDLLREDFDYFFVSTLMVGLVLGTFLSKKLASSSNLKKAWK